jgi:hypothetical protein
MKKAKKRAKSKTSSKRRVKSKTSQKRAGAKSKSKRTTKAKKSVLPKTSTLKQVAKEAAVAAGLAAVGTALSAMQPQEKAAEEAAGGRSRAKNDTSK